MKKVVGVIVILCGVALGLYLGLWVCFIGGIVQLINAIKTSPVNALSVAIGLVRIVCASVVGWLSFIICACIGRILID